MPVRSGTEPGPRASDSTGDASFRQKWDPIDQVHMVISNRRDDEFTVFASFQGTSKSHVSYRIPAWK